MPPDPQGSPLPAQPVAADHPPRSQVREHLHHRSDGARQDRRPRSGDVQEQVVREEHDRLAFQNLVFGCVDYSILIQPHEDLYHCR